jgi:hypothetical protein
VAEFNVPALRRYPRKGNVMSDVLVVLSSEIWGSLQSMVKARGGTLHGCGVWGDGHADETLQQFLDKHLSEMAYDENCHILTAVSGVDTMARCPYPRGTSNGKHRKCGWVECAVCGRYEGAHPNVVGIEPLPPHEYVPSAAPVEEI